MITIHRGASLALLALALCCRSALAEGVPAGTSIGGRRAPVKDRLAVLLLYAHHADRMEAKMPALKENLQALATKVMPWTPLDVLIWYHAPIPESHQDAISNILDGNVYFIRVEDKDWTEPAFLKDEARNFSMKLPTTIRWTNKEAPLEVRRAAQWFINHPFQYAAAHGYQFALKWDQEITVTSEVKTNIVQHFRSQNLQAGHMGMVEDSFQNLAGLAEITRYYITTQGVKVEQLYDFCTPNNVSGVYWNENGKRGWQGKYHSHGMLIRPSVFKTAQAVEYIRLITMTGGLYRHRWNENAILTMVAQLYVPKTAMYEFGFGFKHLSFEKPVGTASP